MTIVLSSTGKQLFNFLPCFDGSQYFSNPSIVNWSKNSSREDLQKAFQTEFWKSLWTSDFTRWKKSQIYSNTMFTQTFNCLCSLSLAINSFDVTLTTLHNWVSPFCFCFLLFQTRFSPNSFGFEHELLKIAVSCSSLFHLPFNDNVPYPCREKRVLIFCRLGQKLLKQKVNCLRSESDQCYERASVTADGWMRDGGGWVIRPSVIPAGQAAAAAAFRHIQHGGFAGSAASRRLRRGGPETRDYGCFLPRAPRASLPMSLASPVCAVCLPSRFCPCHTSREFLNLLLLLSLRWSFESVVVFSEEEIKRLNEACSDNPYAAVGFNYNYVAPEETQPVVEGKLLSACTPDQVKNLISIKYSGIVQVNIGLQLNPRDRTKVAA